MMTNNAVSIAGYRFTPEDKLILDANIWIYINGPQKPGNTASVEAYSQAFSRMLMARSRIYIDVLIVSEFINYAARFKWSVLHKPYGNFKSFRNSPGFTPIARDIAADVKQVLNHCSQIESDFGLLDINRLVGQYAGGGADFNDQVIAALCHTRGLKLVTHDSDFRGDGIDGIHVVTANRRLLR